MKRICLGIASNCWANSLIVGTDIVMSCVTWYILVFSIKFMICWFLASMQIWSKLIWKSSPKTLQITSNLAGMIQEWPTFISMHCISAFLLEFHDRWPLLLKLYYNFYDFNRKFNILGLISSGKDMRTNYLMITETYPYFEIHNRKEQCKLIK